MKKNLFIHLYFIFFTIKNNDYIYELYKTYLWQIFYRTNKPKIILTQSGNDIRRKPNVCTSSHLNKTLYENNFNEIESVDIGSKVNSGIF